MNVSSNGSRYKHKHAALNAVGCHVHHRRMCTRWLDEPENPGEVPSVTYQWQDAVAAQWRDRAHMQLPTVQMTQPVRISGWPCIKLWTLLATSNNHTICCRLVLRILAQTSVIHKHLRGRSRPSMPSVPRPRFREYYCESTLIVEIPEKKAVWAVLCATARPSRGRTASCKIRGPV